MAKWFMPRTQAEKDRWFKQELERRRAYNAYSGIKMQLGNVKPGTECFITHDYKGDIKNGTKLIPQNKQTLYTTECKVIWNDGTEKTMPISNRARVKILTKDLNLGQFNRE